MGQSLDVECTKCGRQGKDVRWGVGKLPRWHYFEYRLYHCKKCEALATADVLLPDKELKAAIAADPEGWKAPAGSMTCAELAKELMNARRWPRCGCGGRLFGSRRSEGLPEDCPACGGRLKVSRGSMMWD